MSTITADPIESVGIIQTNQITKRVDTFLFSTFSPDTNYSTNLEDFSRSNSFPSPKYEDRRYSFIDASSKKDSNNWPEIPTLEGLDSHNPVLTDRIRVLLIKFWAIVMSQALQSVFPIDKAFVEVFVDPNEDRKKISIKLFTEATASQSIAFWDGLEDDIQGWVKSLDNYSQILFLRDISLRIHWK